VNLANTQQNIRPDVRPQILNQTRIAQPEQQKAAEPKPIAPQLKTPPPPQNITPQFNQQNIQNQESRASPVNTPQTTPQFNQQSAPQINNFQSSQNNFSQPMNRDFQTNYRREETKEIPLPNNLSNLPPPPRPKSRTYPAQNTFDSSPNKNTPSIFQVPVQDVINSSQNLKYEKNYDDITQEEDPLDPKKPNFNLDVPSPSERGISPIFIKSEEFSSNITEFPSHIDKDMDKIEYLIGRLNSKINTRDYDGLNDFYRNIYNLYTGSEEISPNERYMISEKINEIFERIKNLYTVEEIV
jgi:hypothetical protein